MALNKKTLEKKIREAYNKVSDVDIDPKDAREQMAKEIAEAIYDFVKSGTVKVTAGIPVSTAGTAAAQTGATTAEGIGEIL